MGKLAKRKRCCVIRISDLPDSVLSHIFSFFPARQVVRTSVLLTRWRYLYTSVTTLNFSDRYYGSSNGFINFVDRVLFSHETRCIERFRLCFDGQYQDDFTGEICGWISSAFKLCVLELYLQLFHLGDPSGILPATLFTGKTLVKFELLSTDEIVMTPLTRVFFPSLKILHIIGVHFADDESIRRLFSGCLVLEELYFSSSWENISIPSLKSFTMKPDDDRQLGLEPHLHIVIDAPSLVDFNLDDVRARSYSLLNLHALVNAHLESIFTDSLVLSPPNVAADIFKGINNNVQSLYVTPDALELFTFCNKSKPLPVFSNLVLLEIAGGYIGICWDELQLVEFLASSPNLKTLIYDLECFETSGDHTKPYCVLLDHLKVIKMKSFEAKDSHLQLVEYFLKNASGLEKLKIHMDYLPAKEQLKITKKVLMFPRVSKACQVETF